MVTNVLATLILYSIHVELEMIDFYANFLH